MKTFKDPSGREWQLAIDGPTVRQVRAATCESPTCRHRPLIDKECTGVDLANFDGAVTARLDADPALLVDVLWLLLGEQAKAYGYENDVAFGRECIGDMLGEAGRALREAMLQFHPPDKRRFLEQVAARRQNLTDLALEVALTRMPDASDPQVREKLVDGIHEALAAKARELGLIPPSSVTGTPDSAASGPTA